MTLPRKKHERTDQNAKMVEALAAAGYTQEEIGLTIGVSHVTVRRYYRDELDTGALRANAKVAARLFNSAMGTNGCPWPQQMTAMVFWAKTRLGWRETNAHEISGPGGGPIETAEASPLEIIESRLARITLANGSGEGVEGSDEG